MANEEDEIVHRLLRRDRQWALEQMRRGLVIRRIRSHHTVPKPWLFKIVGDYVRYRGRYSGDTTWSVYAKTSDWPAGGRADDCYEVVDLESTDAK